MNAYFVTFTYNNENTNGTLRKKDLQDCFKRYRYGVRNTQFDGKFKYYAIGEYGTKTFRPHYHAIVFDCDIHTLRSSWNLGFESSSKLTDARIRYTTNYVINKKNYGKSLKYPPFAIMSKGLGKAYLSDAIKKYHKENFSSTITLEGGQKLPMPRYLREKIFGCETAIKLIGEKNRAAAQRAQESSDYDVEMSRRVYRREIESRNKKNNLNI